MMLKTLLWKDFRQHGKFLVACGVLLLLPYVIAVVTLIGNQMSKYATEEWITIFFAASIANAMLAVVLVAFIAGNSIAGERADRSAEFTAYLPIDRKTAVLSKAITAIGICVGLVTVMSVIAWLLSPTANGGPTEVRASDARMFLATAIPMFGVAWFLSSFVRTPAIAAAMGVAFPVCLGVTCGFLSELESMEKTDMVSVFIVISIAVGLACFAAGVVHYLLRVEP